LFGVKLRCKTLVLRKDKVTQCYDTAETLLHLTKEVSNSK